VPQGITHLFIPGPTNVPDAVRRAMNVAMQDHRAPDFPELVRPLFAGLGEVLGNHTGRVFLFPGSGTGAWEAAITNTLNPGDRVLMARHGHSPAKSSASATSATSTTPAASPHSPPPKWPSPTPAPKSNPAPASPQPRTTTAGSQIDESHSFSDA
jgi:phosphoserine aminotransferase